MLHLIQLVIMATHVLQAQISATVATDTTRSISLQAISYRI